MHTVMLIQEWASIASNVGAERRRAGLQRDVSGHGPGCLGAGATWGAPSNGVPSEDVAPMHQVARMTASLPPTPTRGTCSRGVEIAEHDQAIDRQDANPADRWP